MSSLLLLFVGAVLWGSDFLLASVYFSYFRSRVLSEALDNNTDGIYWIYIHFGVSGTGCRWPIQAMSRYGRCCLPCGLTNRVT